MTTLRWVLVVGSACWFAAVGSGQDKEVALKELLPRIKPLAPNEALKSFRVEKGFRIELVAAEPQVADPIAMTFDEDGRIYVAEMVDYPDKPSDKHPPQGRIRLLEDPDGDGRYDRSTIFADRLTWPGGVAPWKGGVFVCTTPDIYYFKDTDGDGVADLQRKVFTGFQLGKAEDIANGLQRGFDGKIYGVTSFNGGDIRPAGRPDAAPVAVRGRDFRFDPLSERLEAVSSGNGDFGNSFDDWGNRFVGNSGMLLKHVVLTGDYLARNPHLAVPRVHHDVSGGQDRVFRISPPEPWRVVRQRLWQRWVDTSHDMRAARFPARELTPTGYVTGAAGATLYRGSAFPPAYRGNAFIGEVAGNVVVRLVLRPDGVTFAGERAEKGREFLASTDNWFRPVNFANGPDGCLYVVDMYRETIEDPSAIPGDLLKHLDMSSGSDRGRIYRVVPDGYDRPRSVRLGAATTADLVKELASPNAWHRETAQRLLAERQDRAALGPLRDLFRATALPQGRLHSLWTLAELGGVDEATLLLALKDPSPPVREHAVRLAERRLHESAALRERVLALTDDPAPRVRFQVAFTLGELSGDDALAALARLARRDAADPWTRTAILSAVSNRAGQLLQELVADASFLKRPEATEMVGALAAVVGGRNHLEEARSLLDTIFSSDHHFAAPLRRAAVTRLGDGLLLAGSSLGEYVRRAPPASAAAVGLARLFTETAKDAAVEGRPTEGRVEAIRLLGHAPLETAGPVLTELLSARQTQAVQLAAVQALAASPRPETSPLLLEPWPGYSPALRREVVEAIFSRPARLPMLLSALEERRVVEADLDPVRVRSLLQHADERIRRRAEKILTGPARPDRGKIIETYRAALAAPGSADRGVKVFETHCATCHQLRGSGRSVGPDLATVLNRSDEELLVAVLDPNREVKPNYVNYTLATTSGRLVTGIIAQETASTLTLARAEGAQDTILRGQVEQLTSSGLSLMPEGFEKQINPQQMADLLQYLRFGRKGYQP